MNAASDAVREYIEDHGPCGTQAVMDAVGVTNAGNMTRCLKSLKRKGEIANIGGVGSSAVWVPASAAPAPDPLPFALRNRTPLEMAWSAVA